MALSKSLFDIDAAAYTERICNFIRGKLAELERDGIVVAFSGGLDSSTVLLLCVRAVGNDKVKALILPEKQGNPEAETYAARLTDRYGIETIRRDITPVLERIGTYDFVLSRIASRKVQDVVARAYLSKVESPLLRLALGRADPLIRKAFARINSKHRVRLVATYMVAEEHNYLVAGCAHKSEDMLGLYVKFGVDDNADIMPLKNLYRSQILQIAASVGVPDEIAARDPNPDIIPGVSDKYRDLLGLPSELLDLIIFGVGDGMDDRAIASDLGLPPSKVAEIRTLIERTSHMRQPSQTLVWD